MPIVYTNTGKKIFKKAKSLWLLPYRYDSNIDDYVLGQTVYDISSIIGDSITLEQQDGDIQTKNNEFTNTSLVKNITLGETKFTAQCLDLQNDVMKALFNIYTTSNGCSAIRKEYETMYAYIRIRFRDSDTPDIVIPKLLMNNKIMLQQMRTRGAQGNIVGEAISTLCAIVNIEAETSTPGTLLRFYDQTNGSVLYELDTPILFVNRSSKILVFNHKEQYGDRVYDEPLNSPSTNQDCCAHNRYISDNTPYEYTI